MTDKLAKASFSFTQTYGGLTNWSPEEVDKLEIIDLSKFSKVVDDCRFYYRRDPIASTVINKLVEIAITDIIFDKGGISANEFRVFTGLTNKLHDFIEACALEYLISGLVVPEVKYAAVRKETLQEFGIKKYETLTLPVKMWLRDPNTIKIQDTLVMDEPSYYVILPDELVFFIQNKGVYPDGNVDKALYLELITYYPEFVAQVAAGNKEILLDNNKIIRRKVLTGSQYPTPYLYSALEALKHKRNLRRMDYSIASRVIEAIQLIKVGSDDFPLLEGEESYFDDLRQQMSWRNTSGKYMERIFQLFTNHTVNIEWVYPDVAALLNDTKYDEVNQDIFLALGFPRILTTGETERTQTSNAEFAMISPQKTMENIQNQMLNILRVIVRELSVLNGFRDVPTVRFDEINLYAMRDFIQIMQTLYAAGNLSRTTYDKAFGYTFEDEINQKKLDEELVTSLGLDELTKQKEMMKIEQENQPKEDNESKEPASTSDKSK